MIKFEEPKIDYQKDNEERNCGKFVCEPLEPGYGTTLGVGLRRILLSSLPGDAVTSFKIAGLKKGKKTIPGIKEDLDNIVLNIKSLRLKLNEAESCVIKLEADGEKEVTAADIISEDVTVLNPDLHLATVEKGTSFYIEMKVVRGKGYLSAEKIDCEDGEIPVDAMFSPVLRVNYTVQNTRVQNVTDYDKLILDIWTDGSITPNAAIANAAKIFADELAPFKALAKEEKIDCFQRTTSGVGNANKEDNSDGETVVRKAIEDLDLSVRSYNCLKRAGINTVGDLANMTEDELVKVRNLGRKSLDEIKKKLQELGLGLTHSEE